MENIVNFLFELGLLKRIPRSGWFTIGIQKPESVAEHSFRAIFIGYILAKLEGVDSNKVIKLCMVHDLYETRVGDLNLINSNYVKKYKRKAINELLRGLFCKNEIMELIEEFQGKRKEARVARDADRLELILQAKEYLDFGNECAREWIRNAKARLETHSGRKLAAQIEKTNSGDWWSELRKIKK